MLKNNYEGQEAVKSQDSDFQSLKYITKNKFEMLSEYPNESFGTNKPTKKPENILLLKTEKY
jgi:hypothetical protein